MQKLLPSKLKLLPKSGKSQNCSLKCMNSPPGGDFAPVEGH